MPTLEESLARAQAAVRSARTAHVGETAAEARQRAVAQVRAQKKLIAASQNVTRSLTGMDAGGGKPGLTKEGLAQPVKFKDLDLILDEFISDLDRPLRKFYDRIKTLEARVAELEAAPQLTDGGIWGAQKVYQPGQVVTDAGSAWVCKEANANARPGQSDAWRLLVKRGRDGKDSPR